MLDKTLALLLLPAGLTAVAFACTDAGKCTRGTENCAVRESGAKCMGDLVERDGMCVEDDDSDPDGGNAGSGGSGQPDAGPAVECTDESLDAACEAFCEALCMNEENLCVESRCSANDCEPGGTVFIACHDICAEESNPERCAQRLCLGQAEYTCENFGAVDMETDVFTSLCFSNDPKCVVDADYGCSDICGSIDTDFGGVGGDLAGDDMCEDGGEGSVSSTCARGTDCSDCGTRQCAITGEGCSGHGDCCGFYDNGALCVELSSGPTCLASCTDTGTCPDGMRCVEVDDNLNSVCAP